MGFKQRLTDAYNKISGMKQKMTNIANGTSLSTAFIVAVAGVTPLAFLPTGLAVATLALSETADDADKTSTVTMKELAGTVVCAGLSAAFIAAVAGATPLVLVPAVFGWLTVALADIKETPCKLD